MKVVISLAALLFSVASFATPAVGDYSMFKLAIMQGGATTPGTYEASLIGKDNSGSYKMKTVIKIEGQQSQSKEELVTPDRLITDAQIQGVLKNCAAYGGKDSSYEMPDHSKLPTCILPTKDDAGKPSGEVHIAQVPFGIARQVQVEGGRTITLDLQTYTNGK